MTVPPRQWSFHTNRLVPQGEPNEPHVYAFCVSLVAVISMPVAVTILTAIRPRSGGSNGADRIAVRASCSTSSAFLPSSFRSFFDLAVVLGSGEVDAASVEALAVVVGVNHPAGHVVGASVYGVAGGGCRRTGGAVCTGLGDRSRRARSVHIESSQRP